MEKVKNGILKIIQVWRAIPKAQFMLMPWWIFLLILTIVLPKGFGTIVLMIYFGKENKQALEIKNINRASIKAVGALFA